MGFTLADHLEDKVKQIVNSKDWDQETATPIPGTPDMVLVKAGSKAFLERKAAKHIFMIPLPLVDTSCTPAVQILVFVCTS
jgi:hypothetical protein